MTTHTEQRVSEIAGAASRSLFHSLRRRYFRTWYYNWRLRGPVPDRVEFSPKPERTPQSSIADQILQGRYVLPGGQVRMTGGTPWEAEVPNRQWDGALHGFRWMSHFQARPGEDTSRHARWLITTWLNKYRRCTGLAWEPHIIAHRLVSWATNWEMISQGADLIWRSSILRHMERQARHLRRTVKMAPEGLPRFDAALGLVMSGLIFPEARRRVDKGLSLLDREMSAQILADGGHVTRSPEILLETLLGLLTLREALMALGQHVPERLSIAIDRMAPALDFFCMGDGRFGLFNGSHEGDPLAIKRALAGGTIGGSPVTQMPYMGFNRMTAKKTVVLVDTGGPPPAPFNQMAHAGCLSFEMSVAKYRMVTNCGAIAVQGPEWSQAMRATSAHSTLAIDQVSSGAFLDTGFAERLFGPRLVGKPDHVEATRHEKEEGVWLDMTHDGFVEDYGLKHERRLYLDASGNDLRGEDVLILVDEAQGPTIGREVQIRFHLHPDLRTSLAQDRSNVLLVLPNKSGWKFRAAGGEISLEDSVYAGDGRSVKRCKQIVVSAKDLAQGAKINWAFKRLESE